MSVDSHGVLHAARSRIGRLALMVVLLLPAYVVSGAPAQAAPSYKHPLFCGRTYYGTNYANHQWGLDIFHTTFGAVEGHEVMASANGKVVEVSPDNGQVTINHSGLSHRNGDETVYAHMSGIRVSLSQTVTAGQLLGFVSDKGDATAPHLHYGQNFNGAGRQVRWNGTLYPYAYNAQSRGPNFASSHCITPPATDIFDSTFKNDIAWLYSPAEDITSGCAPARYCPQDVVNREQMASFLARYLDLPAATMDYFTDDETSQHEADINRIAQAGISAGCATGRYCPTAVVSREQMATFMFRSLVGLPAATQDYFTDDESSSAEGYINRLKEAGVVGGCTATTYCPSGSVTRGQMAAFLNRGRNYRP